jgi:tetratricopeptide (TPR) repeat protein
VELGYAWLHTADKAAQQNFSQGHELYQTLGDKWGMAEALVGLSRAARNLGALEQAQESATQGLALHQDVGNQVEYGKTLMLLGSLASRQGQFQEAERLIRQGLSAAPETDHEGIAYGLAFLGRVQFLVGQFAEAEASVTESIASYIDLGVHRDGDGWMLLLAVIYLHLGKHHAAHAQIKQAVSLAQKAGFAIREFDSRRLWLLGAVALADGAHAQAHAHFQKSLAVWKRHAGGMRRWIGRVACLGLAACGMGRRAEAREHLMVELREAIEFRQFAPLMVALSGLALLLADEGEAERAVELYALAARHPFVANSRWFEDVAGKHIAAVAAALPADVVAAAQERGRARDLDATVVELLAELKV